MNEVNIAAHLLVLRASVAKLVAESCAARGIDVAQWHSEVEPAISASFERFSQGAALPMELRDEVSACWAALMEQAEKHPPSR